MTELTIDFGTPSSSGPGYGPYADGEARHAIGRRAVRLNDRRTVAKVTSHRSGRSYSLALTWGSDLDLLGIACTCEHGKNHARSWCWHALAVEKQLERYGAGARTPDPRNRYRP